MSNFLIQNLYKKFTDFVSRKFVSLGNVLETLPTPSVDSFSLYFRDNKLVYLNSFGVEKQVSDTLLENHLIGSLVLYAGKDVPQGYLVCDGSKYDTSKYFELFSVLSIDTLPNILDANSTTLIKAKNSYSNGSNIFVGEGLEYSWNSFNNTLSIFNYNKRNHIINGDFRVSQRGLEFKNVLKGFVSDRFYLEYIGKSSESFLNSTKIKEFSPHELLDKNLHSKNYLSITQSKVDLNLSDLLLSQKIEDVRTLAGQEVTLSFFVKSDISCVIGILVAQNFGDNGSSEYNLKLSNNVVSKNWERKILKFKLPDLIGKTIGDNSYLKIGFSLPISSVFTLDLAFIQLEVGSFSCFIHREYVEELKLCRRFFEVQTVECLVDLENANVKQFLERKRVYPIIKCIKGSLNNATFGKAIEDSLDCFIQTNPSKTKSIVTLSLDSEF